MSINIIIRQYYLKFNSLCNIIFAFLPSMYSTHLKLNVDMSNKYKVLSFRVLFVIQYVILVRFLFLGFYLFSILRDVMQIGQVTCWSEHLLDYLSALFYNNSHQ